SSAITVNSRFAATPDTCTCIMRFLRRRTAACFSCRLRCCSCSDQHSSTLRPALSGFTGNACSTLHSRRRVTLRAAIRNTRSSRRHTCGVEPLPVRILIATDTWEPQTNGVVSTLRQTVRHLRRSGHSVELLGPQDFATAACPGYQEIRLALGVKAGVRERFDGFRPETVHIATEGPVGHAVRAFCRDHGLRFTTSYHTQFPEYLRRRAPVPLSWSYALLRRFHRIAASCM